MLDTFRLALATDSDSTHLLATLARAQARADSAKKDAALRTDLGWALLRAGEVADSDDLILKAADAFWAAAGRERHWPYPWYGLGMADLALERRHARVRPSAHQPAGAAWIQTGIIAFEQALKRDRSFRPASIALVQAALDDRFDPTSAAAIKLPPPTDSTGSDPFPFLLFGRLHQRQGDQLDATLSAFESYLDHGGDSAVGLFEISRSLYALDRPAAAESAYFAGAGAIRTQFGTTVYRQDIAYVADSAELRSYDATPLGELSPWLRDFWARRDAAAGQRSGARLEEHNRRWRYATKYFELHARFPARAATRAYQSGQDEFDDRGVVYLRQGEPDERATSVLGAALPNVSWLYFRPAGNLIFHFAPLDPGGWSLLSSLSGLGPDAYDSRIDFSPVYMRLAMMEAIDGMRTKQHLEPLFGDDPIAGLLLRQDSLLTHHSIVIGTTTDAFPLRYPHPLEGMIQAYGAGGAAPETSRLLVVYALPDLRDVPYRTLPDSSVVYALRLRVQAADSLGHLALNTDSVRLIHAHRPLTKDQTLTGFAVLTVPPGEYRAKVMISDSADSIGDGWALADLPAPALDDSMLTLSDPILGHLGSGLAWARPDGTIPLNPLNTFARGGAAVLSYEVGGLRPDTPYTTRITVRKFGADSTHNVISIAFPTTPRSTRELLSKNLGLGNLAPGRYLLVVSIADGTRSAERTRRIVVGR